MQPQQHTTAVSIVSILGKVLDHYKMDKYAIAKQLGIDTHIAYQPDDRLSTVIIQKVWALTKKLTDDDSIGLTFAELIQPSALNGLGLAWITSDTLKDSINRLIRFQKSLISSASYTLKENGNNYQIILSTTLENPVDVSIDASVASLLQMCRITYSPDLKAERVCISHPTPRNKKKFNDFFGVIVEFDMPETMIQFSKSIFDQKLVTANPELARMNDQIVIEHLKRFDKNNISLQVRSLIINKLNDGTPSQNKIASQLNLSLRNLQRKLKSENTSYKMILDNTRSELSKQYLRGSNRSIFEVGFLLGFSDPSNFTRAFKRWHGISPLEYRHNP